MVTASYLSQGLSDQHAAAVDAGVTVVNECGVDPGEFTTTKKLISEGYDLYDLPYTLIMK